MQLYQIGEHEVPLFSVKYLRNVFGGITKASIARKEERGQLPKANFFSDRMYRLYSVEDLAVIDYIFREVWPYKQGVKTPDWIKNLSFDALTLSKNIVVQFGKSRGAEDWIELSRKYNAFDCYRLQLYIESWRRRLLDCDKFFPELVYE